MLEHLIHDIRSAARQIRRAPWFTLFAVVSLAMGISIAVVAYSLINGVLFKPLPVKNPASIVHIDVNSDGIHIGSVVYADLDAFREDGAFAGVAGYNQKERTIAVDNHAATRETIGNASPDLFTVLQMQLELGHTFTRAGDQPEIVISEQYRRRLFQHENPIGKTAMLNGVAFTIIGVTPPGFRSLDDLYSVAAWIPAPMLKTIDGNKGSLARGPDQMYWSIIARLSPGVNKNTATEHAASTARALAAIYPDWNAPSRLHETHLLSQREALFQLNGEFITRTLISLLVLVSIVLTLACTNVAGMLLARSITRRHEVAVRITLGASRASIATQFMLEALLLSLMGGTVGLIASQWATRLISTSTLFDAFDLSLDWRIFGITLITCVLCALAFGLTPITQTLRTNIKGGLSGPGTIGERGNVRGRLIALQVGLSCLLVVVGIHASRSVEARLGGALGFNLDGLLVTDVDAFDYITRANADIAGATRYILTAEDILRSSPYVRTTTRTNYIPLLDRAHKYSAHLPDGSVTKVRFQTVDPRFFATIGAHLLRGKIPDAEENYGGRRVALVDHSVSLRAGRSLVGTNIHMNTGSDLLIVGEIADLASGLAIDSAAQVYEVKKQPVEQAWQHILARVVPGTEPKVMAAFTRAMRDRYPNRIVPTISTLRSEVNTALAAQRYVAKFAFVFGVFELALASIGLYSLLLYATLTRTREIGLRMALGALPHRASFTVVKSGLAFILIGTTVGAALSIPVSRIAAQKFPGADAGDLVPLLTTLAGILLSTIAAAYIPARNAARVEPMAALRHE